MAGRKKQESLMPLKPKSTSKSKPYMGEWGVLQLQRHCLLGRHAGGVRAGVVKAGPAPLLLSSNPRRHMVLMFAIASVPN
jgi:hypothetical protein